MTTLLQLEGFVTEATKHMISKFEGFAQTGIKVNMQEWAQYVSPGGKSARHVADDLVQVLGL